MEELKDDRAGKGIDVVGESSIDPAVCKFTVNREVYPGHSAYFGNRDAANHSLLAQRIFEIAAVKSVLITGSETTVIKSGIDPWPVIGKEIAQRIRGRLLSNDPAVSRHYGSQIPSEPEIRQKVQNLLDEEINPSLGMHGGWVELLHVRENAVYLRMGGGCKGCASAKITLKMGVERVIRGRMPEVGEILDDTDEPFGQNLSCRF